MPLTIEQKKKIIEIRNNTDKGYGEIAEDVGADSRYQVRSFLRTKGAINLGLEADKRARTNTGMTQRYRDREKHFKNLFNTLHPTFSYHSGYKNATELFKCECLRCGHIQDRTAELVRPSYTDYNLQCDNCLAVEREQRIKETKQRNAVVKLKRLLVRVVNELEREQERTVYLTSLSNYVCKECNETFTASRVGQVYCTGRCARRVSDRTKRFKRRLRIESNGVVDNVTLGKLIERDNNECYLCNEECDREDFVITDGGHFVAGTMYPSIDHLIPVSKGGTHTWGNVRLAHHYCNTIKSDNLIGDKALTI